MSHVRGHPRGTIRDESGRVIGPADLGPNETAFDIRGRPTGPVFDTQPDPLSTGIDDFGERIEELSPRFFEVSDRLFDIGTGEDPLFTNMQGGLMDVLRSQEAERVRGLENQFARRGALGTGASAGAIGDVRSEFGQRGTQLANQLAMQRIGVLQQSLDPFSAGIETESLPLQLRIAMENARRAGSTGGGGGGFLDFLT